MQLSNKESRPTLSKKKKKKKIELNLSIFPSFVVHQTFLAFLDELSYGAFVTLEKTFVSQKGQ